ncbi:MAG: hypothetical protein OXD44_10495 [Gammaproteobacteria bacterium]|nr:hypothetical protein [Gammaproteobacteria bacterium]MCY4227153.1 hypothetical protein [Gammaproteobacteria bacterium]MCY4314097.1 hypothetical protein [Gammaproteobacteria bacterium]
MKELRDLLSGIGVVIDEKIHAENDDSSGANTEPDSIQQVIRQLEEEWELPFCRLTKHPDKKAWPQLFKGASFIILDWKLWDEKVGAGSRVEQDIITTHIEFLKEAKYYFIPVVIYTNENPKDVEDKLPSSVYENENTDKNFVFIKQKSPQFDFNALQEWISRNASVYTLKAWEQSFHDAKKDLFGSMFAKNPDWPKVFWKGFKDDGVNPGYSLSNFVNENFLGRMNTDIFEEDILGSGIDAINKEDLRSLIGQATFQGREQLPGNDIRCGDLFKMPQQKYLINIRPDCDCVPRNGQTMDGVELYCVEGKQITDNQVAEKFHKGQIPERINEGIVFSVYEGKSIRFDFKKLQINNYGKLRENRIGRLLHPYITRIQQRHALYLQRQGLPRIPDQAIKDN